MTRRQSVGRGLQLTPGIGGMVSIYPSCNVIQVYVVRPVMYRVLSVFQQQHFFDDEDRTVPSTPTLVVPHRTDGFAEAIQ